MISPFVLREIADTIVVVPTGVLLNEFKGVMNLNETGKFNLNETGLVAYSHGEYFCLGEKIGKFGYSVKK